MDTLRDRPAAGRRSCLAVPLRRLLLLSALLLVAAAVTARAQDLPELTQPVNDFAGVVDASDAADMDQMIRALQQATGDVVVVATVPTYAPYGDIREYAVKLFENHGKGIGEKGKHNGLLVLLAVKDRKVWVEVGYGLEEWITDGFSGETSREYMIPEFRRNAYGAGLKAGVARIIGRIAEARGVTLQGVRPVPAAPPRANVSAGKWIVIAIVVLFIVMRMFGGGFGGGFGGPFGPRRRYWGGSGWSGWSSGIGSFGGGGGGGFGGGFGGFGGGGSGGGGGGGSW